MLSNKFRTETGAGNIGINIGVAAPMAFFPFTGWKDGFFGDLDGQGWDAVEFLRTLSPALQMQVKEGRHRALAQRVGKF